MFEKVELKKCSFGSGDVCAFAHNKYTVSN